MSGTARKLLERGVRSLEPYLAPSGELHDPVFGEPTQYGTPYYALCNAVLARETPEPYLERAVRGLSASLGHVGDLKLPPTLSGFSRADGTATRTNHRDFFWPPVLKTYLILQGLGVDVTGFAGRIAAVDIEAAFGSRPPSNWSAVWLSGEWLRLRAGLSNWTVERFDEFLGGFFNGAVLLDRGLYQEPGHPNSYDLFTRLHFADLLAAGYDGRWRGALERLMATGLTRSLGVRLSDGSLASAHRSTGQSWTLGAQCALFAHAARFFKDDPERAEAAAGAAHLALSGMARGERPHGPFSPVENALPPALRVGYEPYTADAHYSSLALAFLADAVRGGFPADPGPSERAGVFTEHDPLYRALLHRGPYSVHLNALPAPGYDAFGLTDLTFGPGRTLHFVGSVRHPQSGGFYNLGMATRKGPGRGALDVLAQGDYTLLRPLALGDEPVSLVLEGRAKGQPHTYRLEVALTDGGVRVAETTPGRLDYKTLLVPYLRDPGTGVTTEVLLEPGGVRFVHGAERLRLTFGAPVEGSVHLPYGYENRRGLCGLLRVDFEGVREGLVYTVSREA